jgi:Protein of unknown function (DUF3311)
MHNWHPVRLLLIIPFLGVFPVHFYNRVQPTLWSLPFYYWYQMLWVLLSIVVIGLVYVLDTAPSAEP